VGECFFWYWPTRLVPDQRPLNGCVCVCACACACARACTCVRVCVWNMEQLHGTKADCTVNCSNVAFCYLTLVLRNLL